MDNDIYKNIFKDLSEEETLSLKNLLKNNEEAIPLLNDTDLMDYILNEKDTIDINTYDKITYDLANELKNTNNELQNLIDNNDIFIPSTKKNTILIFIQNFVLSISNIINSFFQRIYSFLFKPAHNFAFPYFKPAFSTAMIIVICISLYNNYYVTNSNNNTLPLNNKKNIVQKFNPSQILQNKSNVQIINYNTNTNFNDLNSLSYSLKNYPDDLYENKYLNNRITYVYTDLNGKLRKTKYKNYRINLEKDIFKKK